MARGLVKFNPKSKWKRRGLRGRHVKFLNDYTLEDWLNKEIDFARARVTLTHSIICNVNALRAFAWQQVCRLGEATTVDPVGWGHGDPLVIGKRPSRAHVTGDRVDRNLSWSGISLQITTYRSLPIS